MPDEIQDRLAEVFLAHAGPARLGEATRLGRRGMK